MRRWHRALVIVARLTPFLLAFLRDRRRWIVFGRRIERPLAVHRRRAERLSAAIAALGPTFIKLAQVFSARADILPEPYLSAIGRLQDRVPPDPAGEIEAVIEAELGAPVGAVFRRFEREPVAAASLGQVHRAWIAGRPEDATTGVAPAEAPAAPPSSAPGAGPDAAEVEPLTPVAVKVLRPGVEELIAIDLDISFRVLFALNVLFPNHHVRALTTVVREFSVRVMEEMDFREEAAHMALFHRHFRDDARVRAPAVYDAFTRRRVLVMEWVDGDKVDRLAARFESGELDFNRVMETLTEVYLRMLLVDGFVHADPHPGNILVAADGTLVFLDWGMVIQLDRGARDSILRLALAAGRDDLDGMINGMYELGMIDPTISRAEIRDAAAEILTILDRVRELGPRRVQEMVQQIMNTFYTWPLQLPPELVYFFRAAALLEGIGFRYDPRFNGIELARPVIRRMRFQLLRATAREPVQVARGVMDEARAALQAVREVLRRAEREEFRVRIHPRDLLHTERFLLLQVRRILLSIFAVTIALITSITYLALRSVWLLAAGLALALFMFVIVFFIPTHLLENPLRHARGLRPRAR